MDQSEAFEVFVAEVEPGLRRALVAAYGRERGREATAEALAWAWEHWRRCRTLTNPIGYLFRVGQSRSRRRRQGFERRSGIEPDPWIEPKLAGALAELTEHQRVSVVLVHGFQWQLREVGDLLGVKATTVQNHAERGLARLRATLEGVDHG